MAKNVHSYSLFFILGLGLAISCPVNCSAQQQKPENKTAGSKILELNSIPDLNKARENSENNPSSAEMSFKFAEALRLNGELGKANHQYLHTTEIEPSFYLAYHQIFLYCNEERVLDDAINRLRFVKQDKPNELMLRVALSELLEKKKEYFEASRELIELVFANTVPEKYKEKVNTRIRYLQAKTTSAQARREANAGGIESEDSASKPPLPVTENLLKKGVSLSKVKFDTPDLDADANFRHVPLQD